MNPKRNFLPILVLSITSSVAYGQNTFPSSGNTGIGTTIPDASLEIFTKGYFEHGCLNVQKSLKIVSDGYCGVVPDCNLEHIFSIWPQCYGHGEYYIPDNPFFTVLTSGFVGINQATPSLTNSYIFEVNGDTRFGGGVTVGSLATGSNKMVVAGSTGILSSWDMPTLSISGNNLSVMSGTTTLSTITLPTPSSGADNLGNHIATTKLNMSNQDIVNVGAVQGNSGGPRLVLNSTDAYFQGPSATLAINASSASGYNLYVSGSAYCTSSWSTSDKRFKTDVKEMTDQVSKLYKVKSYSYKLDQVNFPDRNFDNNRHFGFLAQELEQVYPDLVKKGTDGFYAINYQEFIPLLLEGLKEEHRKVEQLENQILELQTAIQEEDNIQTKNQSKLLNKSSLEQNTPNPFSDETIIKFNIVERFGKAFIGIYDLNGKQIKPISIQQGMGNVTVSAHELPAGMYIYSLVVDGKFIDSKKMVITD